MNASELYDMDFVLWTEQQAAAIRSLTGASNSLDAEHLAEEIEDLGRRDVREVESYIKLILVHALKTLLSPGSSYIPHWRSEIVAFQDSALAAFAPSMRQRIAVDRQWAGAIRIVLAEYAEPAVSVSGILARRDSCPVSLDDMLTPHFDLDRFTATFEAGFGKHQAAP